MKHRPSSRLLGLAGACVLLEGLTLALGLAVPWGALAFLGFATVVLFDFLLGRSSRVELSRKLPARWTLGEPVSAVVCATRGAGTAGRIVVRERWPAELQLVQAAPPTWVPAQSEVELEAWVRPVRHGVLAWSELLVEHRSALGLWDAIQKVELPCEVEVLPKVVLAGEALQQLRSLGDPGQRRSRRRGEGMEFESLREYRAGDEPTRIDWKATARSKRVVSRQYTVEKDHDLILAIDSGRLMGARFDGIAKFEHALSAALTLAQQALLVGDRVGLMGFDAQVRGFVPPAKSAAQMVSLLSAAARLVPTTQETDFARALITLDRRHRKRSLIVVFTDFVDRGSAGPMLDVLGALARRHAVLFVAVSDPTLEEVLAESGGEPALLATQASAYLMQDERKLVLSELRRIGIRVLDLAPEALTGPVLNRYLQMREQGVL